MTERIQQLADDIVERYVLSEATKAVERVEKERHGLGCGCTNCARLAVSEVNSWVDFIIDENDDCREIYHYSVAPTKRGVRILSGDNPTKKRGGNG